MLSHLLVCAFVLSFNFSPWFFHSSVHWFAHAFVRSSFRSFNRLFVGLSLWVKSTVLHFKGRSPRLRRNLFRDANDEVSYNTNPAKGSLSIVRCEPDYITPTPRAIHAFSLLGPRSRSRENQLDQYQRWFVNSCLHPRQLKCYPTRTLQFATGRLAATAIVVVITTSPRLLSHLLPRVISVKFPLQLHQKYCTTTVIQLSLLIWVSYEKPSSSYCDDVIFLLKLHGKLNIDHSQEWKG